MDQLDAILQSFDMLDMVLIVFFACIFALWRGHGKKLSGLLTGVLVGALVKPALFFMIGSAAVLVSTDNDSTEISDADQKKIDKMLSEFQ